MLPLHIAVAEVSVKDSLLTVPAGCRGASSRGRLRFERERLLVTSTDAEHQQNKQSRGDPNLKPPSLGRKGVEQEVNFRSGDPV